MRLIIMPSFSFFCVFILSSKIQRCKSIPVTGDEKAKEDECVIGCDECVYLNHECDSKIKNEQLELEKRMINQKSP